MAENTATSALAGILSTDPERVLNDLAENLAALVGVAVSIEPLRSDAATLGPIFGNKHVYLFPIEDQASTALSACVAMDIPGAACTGGALIMMPADAIKQVLQTQTVPDMLHDSVGEVANIIVGAMQQVIGKQMDTPPDFRRATNFRQEKSGTWPALLQEVDKTANWVVVAGKILFEQEHKGTILIASSSEAVAASAATAVTGSAASRTAIGDAAIASPIAVAPPSISLGELAAIVAGLKVQVAGFPADSAAVSLRNTLERLGMHVFPLHAGLTANQPDVMFVVSRSHTDLKLRLGAIAGSGRRPALLIACSDRATREIVLAASQGVADDFLVLPADLERLKVILSKAPALA